MTWPLGASVSPPGLTGSVSPAPRFVCVPLSRWLGVRDQARRPAKPNAILEKYFLTEGCNPKEVSAPCLPIGLHGCLVDGA